VVWPSPFWGRGYGDGESKEGKSEKGICEKWEAAEKKNIEYFPFLLLTCHSLLLTFMRSI
jgi:hypothetical protein